MATITKRGDLQWQVKIRSGARMPVGGKGVV